MTVGITSSSLPPVPCQVKRVLSATTMILGQCDGKVYQWAQIDLSAFGTANSAMCSAEQQPKNPIPPDPHYLAVYESDPVVADRVISVDKYGKYYDASNPYPISFDGTVSVGDVVIVDQTTKDPMKVNADGSINTVTEPVPAPGSQVISTYAEVSSVASGFTTQIVSYTVPVGYKAVLQRCPVSGENVARYDLLVNGVKQDTVRTNFGGDLTQMFDFTSGNTSGLVLNAGDIVSVQVLHNRPYTASFEARIQVLQITL